MVLSCVGPDVVVDHCPSDGGSRLVMARGGGSGGGGSTLVAAVVDPITLLHTNCSAPWKHISLLFIAKSAEAILHLQCVYQVLDRFEF